MATHESTPRTPHELPAEVLALLREHGASPELFLASLADFPGLQPMLHQQRCMMLALAHCVTHRAALAAVRRAQREAKITARLATLTRRLRALSGSGASLAQARAWRDRYARAIGVSPGVGGDVLAEWLLSEEAGELSIEDIDARFVALGNHEDEMRLTLEAVNQSGRWLEGARRGAQ